MRQKIYTTALVILMAVISMTAVAQDQSDQAETYFSEYLTSRLMGELIVKSLPTLEDCQLVFKGKDAEFYFKAIEEMKAKSKADPEEENETFADVRVESFSTWDMDEGNGNYAGGMERIRDKLQSGTVFYKVSLLREKDAERGLAFKYWVNINGRWVFFPKPYSVFEQ